MNNGLDNAGKGSYLLISHLPAEQRITVGSLKSILFSPGYYTYAGSALSGFKTRLNRHLKREKKPHWHIDYLLKEAAVAGLILIETTDRLECTIARALNTRFDAITGFGASDCRCPSHLFHATEEITPQLITLLDSLHLGSRSIQLTYP